MILDGQPWPQRLPSQAAGQVSVRVLNGTGTPGLAGQTASRLRGLGFRMIGAGDAPPTGTTTVTYAGTAQADSAYTLMSALDATPAAQDLLPEPDPRAGPPGPVTLIIGADFAGIRAPGAPRPPGTPGRAPAPGTSGAPVQVRNAAASICSGLPAANPRPGRP